MINAQISTRNACAKGRRCLNVNIVHDAAWFRLTPVICFFT
jgi:hypothetical protein